MAETPLGMLGSILKWLDSIREVASHNTYVFTSNILRRLPGVRSLDWGERSYKSISGEFLESPLSRRELGSLGEMNTGRINLLKVTEDKWNSTEAFVWLADDPLIPPPENLDKGVIGRLLFYRDREIIEREINLFSKSEKFVITSLIEMYGEREAINRIKSKIKQAHGNDSQLNAKIDTYFANNRAEISVKLMGTYQYKLDGELVNLFPELGLAYERDKNGSIIFENNKPKVKKDDKGREIWAGEEIIYPLGWQNWREVIAHVSSNMNGFITDAGGAIATGNFSEAILRKIESGSGNLISYLERAYIGSGDEGGEKSHYDFVKNLKDPYVRMDSIRKELLKIRPANVRFQHTFKVIMPFIKGGAEKKIKRPKVNDETGEVEKDAYDNPIMEEITIKENLYLGDQAANHPKWYQTEWEKEAGAPPGYDENGYPLEINDDGEVLLDKWWHETSQSEKRWQERIIAKKAGGDEILKRINHFRKKENCRVVNKRWANPAYGDPYLDIVDMGAYMYVHYDTYRDDLRDGRHHLWSKTAYDYLVASQGGFDVAPHIGYNIERIRETSKLVGKAKLKFGILRKLLIKYRSITPTKLKTIIPTKNPGTPRYDENDPNDYIKKMPDDFFKNIDEEEMLVVRNYKIRLTDGPDGRGGTVLGEFNPDKNKIESEEDALGPIFGTLIRRPIHANPAFDRRALNRKGEFIHWGRMLYYEGQDGVNRWSENPFPHISSRGLAQYIRNRAIIGLYSFEDQKRTVREVGASGYDFGIRRPLVGGTKARFPVDILGGTDAVQDDNW